MVKKQKKYEYDKRVYTKPCVYIKNMSKQYGKVYLTNVTNSGNTSIMLESRLHISLMSIQHFIMLLIVMAYTCVDHKASPKDNTKHFELSKSIIECIYVTNKASRKVMECICVVNKV